MGGGRGREGGKKKNIFRNEFVRAGTGYCFLTAGVQQSTKAGGRGPLFPLSKKKRGGREDRGGSVLGVDISPLHFHHTAQG